MKNSSEYKKYIYWIASNDFTSFKNDLESNNFELRPVKKTSCETLKAKKNIIRYASPEIFNGLCKRQGSWYRESNKAGKYLVVSNEKLLNKYDSFLDTTLSESDFSPQTLPDKSEIKKLINSEEYQSQRPNEWEKKTFKEAIMVRALFTLTGAWGLRDSLRKQWNNHRANHANFLNHEFTTTIDGEEVPYSVTNNNGVCSSCVEFFNIIDQKSRKMVRSCPGAVHFSNVKMEKYYDIQPMNTNSNP